jgi:HSP20 family protein
MLLTRRQNIADPFTEMRALVRALDRMWDEWLVPRTDGEPSGLFTWRPSVDILEANDAHIIRMDLPGLSPDQVKVEIKDNQLTVSGSREESRTEEGVNYHRQERCFGAFHRSFELPSNIKTDAITANFSNGVLEIRLPKAEEAKPRQVRITSGN